MTSQLEKQTVATHILPNISRSKGNQTMKFSQLREYNIRNVSGIIHLVRKQNFPKN